jgi:signal transduction histidine kinase
MAEDLDKSQAALIRAEKDAAWREMARQVSHDIKNPLTPMKLWVQLLERAWNDKSPEFESILRRSCETLDHQIEVLRRSATDFLALAGASSAPAGGAVNVGALLDAVVELYAAVAREGGVAVVRTGSDAVVPGDAHKLQRAFVNLLDNALEAAPRGTTVDIAVEKLDGRVRVTVTDRGAGIDAEARGKLFTPNFSTKSRGTGLGLVNVRWIVEAHGGRVYLDESRRDGTSLVVELPAGIESAAGGVA